MFELAHIQHLAFLKASLLFFQSGIQVFLLWWSRNSRPHAGTKQLSHICSSESTQVWKVWFQTFRASALSSCSLSSSRSAEVWKECCCCAEPPRPRFTIWWTAMSLNRLITLPHLIVSLPNFPNLIFCFRSWQKCLIVWRLKWEMVGSPPCPSCRW